jgi:hypothetical protein
MTRRPNRTQSSCLPFTTAPGRTVECTFAGHVTPVARQNETPPSRPCPTIAALAGDATPTHASTATEPAAVHVHLLEPPLLIDISHPVA